MVKPEVYFHRIDKNRIQYIAIQYNENLEYFIWLDTCRYMDGSLTSYTLANFKPSNQIARNHRNQAKCTQDGNTE